MTDVKQWWTDEHDNLLRLAKAAKNPMSALFDMYERYNALKELEKKEVDELLFEWIDGDDKDKRYTALAIAEEYNIPDAIPAMKRLCDRFKDSKIPDNPENYYERKKVLSKIQKLEQQAKNS